MREAAIFQFIGWDLVFLNWMLTFLPFLDIGMHINLCGSIITMFYGRLWQATGHFPRYVLKRRQDCHFYYRSKRAMNLSIYIKRSTLFVINLMKSSPLLMAFKLFQIICWHGVKRWGFAGKLPKLFLMELRLILF